MSGPLPVGFKYNGGTPGADANTYSIFNTDTAFNASRRQLLMAGYERVMVGIEHDQPGTLNSYRRDVGSTTWHQKSSTSVAAPAANTTSEVDFLITGDDDWKVEWVNGGVAQGTFAVKVAATAQRVIGN